MNLGDRRAATRRAMAQCHRSSHLCSLIFRFASRSPTTAHAVGACGQDASKKSRHSYDRERASLIFSILRYYLRSSLSPVQGAVGRTGEGAGATEPPARTGRHVLLPRMQQKCALDLPRDECFTTLHSPAHIKFWGVKQCPLADEALDRLANARGSIRI